ncbi:MAG: capsular exopolysaccharide biosynthesis protein [Planctomycetota bacterium]|nr:capsular exopolysaccharide biosynthesis protein [Planctomycetota bacterium]
MTTPTPSAPPALDSPSRGLVEEIRRLLGIARRGWPIVAVAVLTCLTVAVVYLARKTTLYQATSRLLVLQQGKIPVSLSSGDGGRMVEGVEDYLPTQALILRSPLVVGRALESLDRKGLSAREVINRLTVTRPDPVAKVLQVGYLSGEPRDAEQIVAAILASYEQFLNDYYHKKNNDVTDLLKKARDELSGELEGLERKYLELLRNAPAQATDEAGGASQLRRVEQWEHAAGEAKLKAVQLRAQLELGRKLADKGASLSAIVQAMGHMGGVAAPSVIPQNAGDPDTSLRARLVEELADLELRRASAGRLLNDLARAASNPAASQPVDAAELARLFSADPYVASLREQIRTSRDGLVSARRVARNPIDPPTKHFAARIASLEGELDKLWTQRRPSLVEQLGRDEHSEAEAHKSKADLAVVRAREETLKGKLAELDADAGRRLEACERELAGHLDPGDTQGLALQAQIFRLRNSGRGATGRPEQGAIRDLLDAIEHGLASVEAIRAEIHTKFTEDLNATKRSEIDRLAMANVRSNLERQRTLFNTVVDQLKQMQLAGDFSGITAQVVDPPSTSPVRASATLVLGVALVVGLTLGMGAALVAEQLDPRLRSVEEIRQVVSLAVLGLIPQLPARGLATLGGLGLLGHALPRSPVAEGFRVVRTNLDLRRRRRPSQVILVTSPVPGDGKTTTASNLAISLAQAGRRVLLIDADLRRPRLNAIHGLPREPGLTQILGGQLPIHQGVQATAVPNLDLVCAGSEVPNPAELLTSPFLGEFLKAARETYEEVIIDSPPLLTVADAAILGGLADGILMVVRAAAVRRQDAVRSIELLSAIGTPALGIVINGANRQQGGYGYGYGYGSNGSEGPPPPLIGARPIPGLNGHASASREESLR